MKKSILFSVENASNSLDETHACYLYMKLFITTLRYHSYQNWIESNTNGDVSVRVHQLVLIHLLVASRKITFIVVSILPFKRRTISQARFKHKKKSSWNFRNRRVTGSKIRNRLSAPCWSPFVRNRRSTKSKTGYSSKTVHLKQPFQTNTARWLICCETLINCNFITVPEF